MSSNSPGKQKNGSRRPKWIRWTALVLVVALIGAGTYFVVKARQTKSADATTSTLQKATARTGNLILQDSGSGYLVAASEANISFEIDGKLAELDIALGDKVEKGQLLAKLDDETLQYKLQEAQLALLELTSPEAVANARLAVTSAESDVINAQYSLNNQEYWKNEALIQEKYAAMVLAQANLDRAKKAYDSADVGEYINNSNEAVLYQNLYNTRQAYDTAKHYYSLYSQKPTQRQYDEAQANLDLAKAQLTNAQNYLTALTGGEVPEDATGSKLAGRTWAARYLRP